MMIIKFLNSYDRSFKKLDKQAQAKTIAAIDSLIDFLNTRQQPQGLGLKKLYRNYWEIRLNIRNRIIFEFSKNEIIIAFVGDHNSVRDFLKNF